MQTSEVLSRLALPLVACLTLGLAPFLPRPHLVEKIQWLFTGHPFRPVDVFDLLFHAAPWVWLLVELGRLMTTTPSE